MPAILGLFNLFSLFYIFRSLQLSATIWREWSSVVQEPLTRRKKSLVEQASFFIAVPIGVLLHELGHALAVWAFGGQVVEFGYRVFWGYVVPQGTFSQAQNWLIGLAGTLGSLVFGVAIWLLLKRNKRSALRFFGLRAFRFQVYFSTIYYPLFTLFGFDGDWKTIYDFRATPLLSGLLVPLHLGLVLLFYWGDRTGWFERPSHETIAERDQFTAVQEAASRDLHDTAVQLKYIDMLRQAGVVNRAKTALKTFLNQNPNAGPGYLELAILESAGKSQIPRRASEHLQKALSLGVPNPVGQVYAHQLLGKYHLDRNEPETAINHLDEALAQKGEGEETAVSHHKAVLYHLRSQAHRRQRQYELAYQDIRQAVAIAQKNGDENRINYYREEQAIIENHAGRTLGLPNG